MSMHPTGIMLAGKHFVSARVSYDRLRVLTSHVHFWALSFRRLSSFAQQVAQHLSESGNKPTSKSEVVYRYPEVQSTGSILPSHKYFSPSSATVAHTWCLEFLKKRMNGPRFDLKGIGKSTLYLNLRLALSRTRWTPWFKSLMSTITQR